MPKGCPVCHRNPKRYYVLTPELKARFRLPDAERRPICGKCYDASDMPATTAVARRDTEEQVLASVTQVQRSSMPSIAPMTTTETDHTVLQSMMLTSNAPMLPLKIPVVRTNWLYRKQDRVLCFDETGFSRLLPEGGDAKERFLYSDIAAIQTVPADPTQLIIKFKSGQYAQYLQSPRASEIVSLLARKAAHAPLTSS